MCQSNNGADGEIAHLFEWAKYMRVFIANLSNGKRIAAGDVSSIPNMSTIIINGYTTVANFVGSTSIFCSNFVSFLC